MQQSGLCVAMSMALGFTVGDRAVVDDRDLIAAALFHVPVDGVVAAVDLSVRVPFVQIIAAFEQRLGGGCGPVDGLRLIHPIGLWIVFPALIRFAVAHLFIPPQILRGTHSKFPVESIHKAYDHPILRAVEHSSEAH